MPVRAKMMCSARNESYFNNADGTRSVAAQVTLAPQYVSDPTKRPPENAMFGEATPSGQVTMFIVNDQAHRQFRVGRQYYVDFTECPEDQQG